MNVLDILLAVFAALAVLRSFYRGLVREAAAIAGLAAGIYLAAHHCQRVGGWLPWIGPPAAHMLAFLLIVAAVYALFSLLSHLLRGALKVVLLGWLDHALGAALGVAEAALLCAAILMVLVAFLPPGPRVVRHSRLALRLYPVADRVAGFTPAELRAAYSVKKQALLHPAPAPQPKAPAKTPARPGRKPKAKR